MDLGLAGKSGGNARRAAGIAPWPPSSERQICRGILMFAKLVAVKGVEGAVSASTAALILASCAQLVGLSPLRTCSQNDVVAVQY
jgi:hypothetical protein